MYRFVARSYLENPYKQRFLVYAGFGDFRQPCYIAEKYNYPIRKIKLHTNFTRKKDCRTAAFGAVKHPGFPRKLRRNRKIHNVRRKSAVLSVGAEIGENEVECPTCKAKNPKGQKFCSSCGAKLRKNCPHCGAEIESGTKSCPQCGGSAEEPAMVCVKCGAVLKEGQAFCPSCGTKQEKPCPSCGAVMESDAKFCPVCGASGDDVKLCPNCKAEIKGNAAFCSKCGTKNQLKIRAVPKTTVTPVFMSVDFFWRV